VDVKAYVSLAVCCRTLGNCGGALTTRQAKLALSPRKHAPREADKLQNTIENQRTTVLVACISTPRMFHRPGTLRTSLHQLIRQWPRHRHDACCCSPQVHGPVGRCIGDDDDMRASAPLLLRTWTA